ncbi:MAG: DUF2007 domain-containing protein [Hyphomicrobiaceae bacterium]|jgi:hypothetical protein|nr:DUF2007 domain-containing protein [Hyphomicrobiaceae bacterium]
MREVLLAQDSVLITFVEALLRDANIEFAVLDRNLHSMHIAPGWAPQRVMVNTEQWERARQVLLDAELGPYLTKEKE